MAVRHVPRDIREEDGTVREEISNRLVTFASIDTSIQECLESSVRCQHGIAFSSVVLHSHEAIADLLGLLMFKSFVR